MTSNFETTQLKKHVSYEDQVQEMIREKVLAGEFALGEKIPSARKIAAELGTNSFTVLRALSVLRKEGLLISHVGKGTFVQKREEKLACVGVYCPTGRNFPYSHAVAEALRDELDEAGIEMDLWMDPRPVGAIWRTMEASGQGRGAAAISSLRCRCNQSALAEMAAKAARADSLFGQRHPNRCAWCD